MVKPNGKRPAPAALGPSKKRKIAPAKIPGPKKYLIKPKEKGKEKAADRGIIPIPFADEADDVDLSDQDLEVLEAYGGAASFLDALDHNGISRSKKETDRLHRLNKPVQKRTKPDKLPSVDSHDEDDGVWSSGIDDLSSDGSGEDPDASENEGSSASSNVDSDTEMPYEMTVRKRRSSWDPAERNSIQRLPIKLANGLIQGTGSKAAPPLALGKPEEESDDDADTVDELSDEENAKRRMDDVSTGARFGRLAVVDIIGNKSRKARIQGAKEQIASICQEIVGDPENNLGLLRRLHSFSLPEVSTPTHPDPVKNDPTIRKLAMLSQLAVFKDIIPGYRIRALTDKEKAEKVGQMVARTREWEQGLLIIYQTYLRALEVELKARSDLAELALQCMCTLLTEVTHFNFRVNLMTCIVTRLSKKSWDKTSDLCLNTIITVFRADLTGVASLEVVRLLNRMVKERGFNIHPEVLSCLLHLRLKTELGVRASESRIDRDKPKPQSSSKAAARRAKGKSTDQPHLSKKIKKALKEKKEIEKEFREAEAEVDKEERASTQTETLKLLFVLYFRILKNPDPTPLLPKALHGIARYAHLVNIDFFKDLMKVLKDLISREVEDGDESNGAVPDSSIDARDTQHRLLCIVTAFELLSGQGEALNIDLSDFISRLYSIILPLSLMGDIDTPPPTSFTSDVRTMKPQSVADMLFRALNIVFSPRTFGTAAPPWRSAAFAKRLLTASLHWPPSVALRALDFVGGLLAKDAKLEALLSSEDRTVDGVYRPEIDDPQLCHPFGTSFLELYTLQNNHWDSKVRAEAKKLINFTRS